MHPHAQMTAFSITIKHIQINQSLFKIFLLSSSSSFVLLRVLLLFLTLKHISFYIIYSPIIRIDAPSLFILFISPSNSINDVLCFVQRNRENYVQTLIDADDCMHCKAMHLYSFLSNYKYFLWFLLLLLNCWLSLLAVWID